ncbi:MAG: malto-oligosyltrehalose trehalohydrolase [Nitrospirae bacterium]|nr:malto-oligosyltrehalose trehalohydrolase [Nitrospirota bacterium]
MKLKHEANDKWRLETGASLIRKDTVRFRVWAQKVQRMDVVLVSDSGVRVVPMVRSMTRSTISSATSENDGFFEVTVGDVGSGSRYLYRLDGKNDFPDPVSRFQPDGVHKPSQVVDPGEFGWPCERGRANGEWKNIPLPDYIIYELHVGTFTKEGTFEAIIPYIEYLLELGVTAIELMPVSQFPGGRNWGYDGVHPYAPQNTYGGPMGLKKLIDSCHAYGIAVILDVVYNHLGPEGNYLGAYAPFFTNRYRTPWGDAVNFDGPYSDEVVRYFTDNVRYWIDEYHVDAFRVDAVHAIFDFGANHFLKELASAIHDQGRQAGRDVYIIAESDLNDSRVINPVERGGYGCDSQWSDDLHHALHTLLTDDRFGYYEDFLGELRHIGKAMMEGFVYSGQYSAYRKRMHGNSSAENPAHQFVVFSQNHDQVGNRARGDRLSQSLALEKLKLAAALVLLSPYVPLLFMGEEYGEKAPFQYFVSHLDPDLVESVRKGRKRDFASFRWKREKVPDPQAESTFFNSKLNVALHAEGTHGELFDFYRALISLRKRYPALRYAGKDRLEVIEMEKERVLIVMRWFLAYKAISVYSFNEDTVTVDVEMTEGSWYLTLDNTIRDIFGPDGICSTDSVSSVQPIVVSEGGQKLTFAMMPYGFVLYLNSKLEPVTK